MRPTHSFTPAIPLTYQHTPRGRFPLIQPLLLVYLFPLDINFTIRHFQVHSIVLTSCIVVYLHILERPLKYVI